MVVVQLAHLMRVMIAAFEARDLPPADDALPWGKRETVRRTLDLAESALDALVDNRVARRQRFQMLDMRVGIVVENDARVEEAVGIERRLSSA